jgi:hypothetical protein
MTKYAIVLAIAVLCFAHTGPVTAQCDRHGRGPRELVSEGCRNATEPLIEPLPKPPFTPMPMTVTDPDRRLEANAARGDVPTPKNGWGNTQPSDQERMSASAYLANLLRLIQKVAAARARPSPQPRALQQHQELDQDTAAIDSTDQSIRRLQLEARRLKTRQQESSDSVPVAEKAPARQLEAEDTRTRDYPRFPDELAY